MMNRLAIVSISVVALAACEAGGHREPAAAPTPAPTPARPAPSPSPQDAAMTAMPRSPLPTPFDVRVTRALATPVPPSIAIAFDHVAMAKSPTINDRYQLATDGALYFVRHSGKPGDWQEPFDQPLPGTPTTQIAPARVQELLAALDAGGFFTHPGYEANPQVEGGSYWIVRARRGADLHAVVFQNTQPAYVAALSAVADPLR